MPRKPSIKDNNSIEISDSISENNNKKEQVKKSSKRTRTAWTISDLKDENNNITENGWEKIDNLTKFIIKKHFSTTSIKKDIYQEGFLKAAYVIKNDPENGNYRNFRTYLYTCIRNEISNYLYHTHKRMKEVDFETSKCKTTFVYKNIDKNYIEKVFNKLPYYLQKYKTNISNIVDFFSESDNAEVLEKNFYVNKDISSQENNENFIDRLSELERSLLTLVIYIIKHNIE